MVPACMHRGCLLVCAWTELRPAVPALGGLVCGGLVCRPPGAHPGNAALSVAPSRKRRARKTGTLLAAANRQATATSTRKGEDGWVGEWH